MAQATTATMPAATALPPAATVLLADGLHASGVRALEDCGCSVHLDASLKGELLAKAIATADPDVLVVRSTGVDAAALGASDRLSVVIRAGAGYDTIDVADASRRGIFVANCPGQNSVAVAELAWGLILACDRRLPDQVRDLRDGNWRKKEYASARGLRGRTLGIIGLGGIGREVAARGRAFGMRVIAWSPRLRHEDAEALGVERADDLHALAAASQVVSVHVTGDDATRHLVDEVFLAQLPDGAILVNTSRGSVVDEVALERAVRERSFRAGLDVFSGEPSSGEAEFSPAIVDAPGVYATHHVGASTEQAQESVAAEVVRIIRHWMARGEVPNCINRAASTPAAWLLSIRHRNEPGVLAHTFEVIGRAGINVEEMENIIYEGGAAACARIQLDDRPSDDQLSVLGDHESVYSVTVAAIHDPPPPQATAE